MKFCNTCYKTVTDNKIKIGDECPELGCFGKITEEEDIMVPLYIKLRKKNYHPYGFISGEDGKDDFYVILYNIQTSQHLPPLPKDIKAFQYLIPPPKNIVFEQEKVIVLKRKLLSKVKSKRHIEIQKAAKDFGIYIDIFPTLYTIQAKYTFSNSYKANILYNHFLLSNYAYSLSLNEESREKKVYISRAIKNTECKAEVEILYELYEKMDAYQLCYEILKF